ncbi:MAG: spore germination protein [Clostridia bacterium]|nr:spore germination protein [Clostridia bacterium]
MENRIKEEIMSILGNGFDVESHEVLAPACSLWVIYVDENTEKAILSESVLKPLSNLNHISLEEIKKLIYPPATVSEIDCALSGAQEVAKGNVIIIAEETIIALSMKKVAMRPVMEPPTSTVLKGPREGFVENLNTNMSLLRRRLATTDLRVERFIIGKYSQTAVVLSYIKGIAHPKIVKKIRKKIESICVDGIMDSSYVAKYLTESNYSLFRQVGTTEKPDILAHKMLEGRVAVLVDGSPIALTLPFLFIEDLQDSSDYYRMDFRATMLRLVRLFAIVLAVLLPGVFVALQEYQYQVLPLKFLITILNSTTGIPLTPTLEMLLVILIFEVLNETSLRMPKYVGMALSVVGAVVLGDTAVKAGLLSSPAVLVAALSGIGLYCVPDSIGTFSVLRVLCVGLGGVLGLFGIVVGLIAITAYLVAFDSYGAPYLAPYAPIIGNDMQDGLFKRSNLSMKKRPESIPNVNKTRMKGEEK